MINIPLLTTEDIEVRVKQVTKSGAVALLYKTSRVDRRILNEVFGLMNWTSDYKTVKDNLYCGIGIRESKEDPFVWHWDCGVESREDEEGNEKKGEATSAFKRAASQIGIGEELYSSPQIFLEVATQAKGDKYVLANPKAKYVVTHIAYNEKTRKITELEICNAVTDVKVFSWKIANSGAMAKKMIRTLADETEEEEEEDEEESSDNGTENASDPVKLESDSTKESRGAFEEPEEKPTLKKLVVSIGTMVKKLYTEKGNANEYTEIVREVTGGDSFKCNSATDEDYDTVYKIYKSLITKGYSG